MGCVHSMHLDSEGNPVLDDESNGVTSGEQANDSETVFKSDLCGCLVSLRILLGSPRRSVICTSCVVVVGHVRVPLIQGREGETT
eukprot:9009938-Pyramimonas_sp.AAC.2